MDFYPKTGHLEFSGVFFLAEIFEKVCFDPYNFRITRLSTRKSEQTKIFRGYKYAYIYRLNTKIRLTMLCLSGFELYSSWVPASYALVTRRFLSRDFVQFLTT